MVIGVGKSPQTVRQRTQAILQLITDISQYPFMHLSLNEIQFKFINRYVDQVSVRDIFPEIFTHNFVVP